MPHPITSIAQAVGGSVVGDGALQITGVEQLDRAQPGQVTFVRDARNAEGWAASKASAALVTEGVELEPGVGRAVVFVPDADLALARVLEMFAPPKPRPSAGVHPTAVVDPGVEIGAGVAIGPLCVVGAGVKIGDGTVLHGRVTVEDGVTIGKDCELSPGVVVHARCVLGHRVNLHSNVVVGGDGFGYRPDPERGLVKIPHVGHVEIGDDVEVGAGTCIDRGKFSATTIGMGTKIDNLCQIAHNCRVGCFCVLAGQVGLAGSVTLGDGVMMGGRVAIKDQVTIGSGVRIAACAAVMDNIPDGQAWGGYPAQDMRLTLREQAALRKLPELVKLLRNK